MQNGAKIPDVTGHQCQLMHHGRRRYEGVHHTDVSSVGLSLRDNCPAFVGDEFINGYDSRFKSGPEVILQPLIETGPARARAQSLNSASQFGERDNA